MAEKLRKGNEWRVAAWMILGAATLVFAAFSYRESTRKHAPKPLHTPLAPKEAPAGGVKGETAP